MEGDRFIEGLSLPKGAVGAGSVVTRTHLQKEIGHFRPELRYTCDIEVLMRLACLGSVAKTNGTQFIKRQHGDNISVEYWGDWKAELEHLLDAYESFFHHEGAHLPDAARLKWKVKKNIAQRAYWSGLSHRLRGLNSQSSALFKLAYSTYPLSNVLPPISYWLKVENPGLLFFRKIRDVTRSRAPSYNEGRDGR
jgi:hypothetical protein